MHCASVVLFVFSPVFLSTGSQLPHRKKLINVELDRNLRTTAALRIVLDEVPDVVWQRMHSMLVRLRLLERYCKLQTTGMSIILFLSLTEELIFFFYFFVSVNSR